MENQLFTWESFNVLDDWAYQFYNIITVVKIGSIEAGNKFAIATVDYESGKLSFLTNGDETEPSFEFDLLLTVK